MTAKTYSQLDNEHFWDKVSPQKENFSQDLTEIIEIDIRKTYERIEEMESIVKDCQKEFEDVQNEIDTYFVKKMAEYEEERNKIKKLTENEEKIIQLNVGGQIFTTFKTTLSADKDSMLAAMFSGVHEVPRSVDGAYFIDYDGKHFRCILNYLRGKITSPSDLPSEPDVLNEIKADADYLQTRGLKYLISRKDPRLSQDYFSKFFVFDTTYHPISSVSFNGLNMEKISFANISFIFSVSFADASLVGVSFWYSIFKSRGNSVQGFTQVNFSSADLQECDF